MPLKDKIGSTAKYLWWLNFMVYLCYVGAGLGYAQYAYFRLRNGIPDLAHLALLGLNTAVALIGLCTHTARQCLKALDARLRAVERVAQPNSVDSF